MMTEQPNWAEIHIGLCATFPEDEIKQRPGRGGQQYDYIDARAVMDRLDEVVGPDNWEARFAPLPDSETSKAVECTLTIYGISKADVGYPNSAQDAGNDANEPWKASYSDALKRAAVHWGVGRFLYGGAAKQHGKPAGRAAAKPEPRGPYPREETAQAMQENPAAAVHAERIKSAGKGDDPRIARWQQVQELATEHGTAINNPASKIIAYAVAKLGLEGTRGSDFTLEQIDRVLSEVRIGAEEVRKNRRAAEPQEVRF